MRARGAVGPAVEKRRGEARKGCEERKRAMTQGERGGFAVASGSCEGGGGMSSSGERGSPWRGMRGRRGAGKGVERSEKRGHSFGECQGKEGTRMGAKELGGREFFFSGRTQGKKGRLAVASGSCRGGGGMSSSGERGSPCGGCVGEGRGETRRRGQGAEGRSARKRGDKEGG